MTSAQWLINFGTGARATVKNFYLREMRSSLSGPIRLFASFCKVIIVVSAFVCSEEIEKEIENIVRLKFCDEKSGIDRV